MSEKLRIALFPLASVAMLLTLPVTSSVAEETIDKGVAYYVDSETGRDANLGELSGYLGESGPAGKPRFLPEHLRLPAKSARP